jgi:hypothetical protein
MITIHKRLYEAKDPEVTVELNDADVLSVIDSDGKPIYILELKVSRKD